jgi:hypothetical protein
LEDGDSEKSGLKEAMRGREQFETVPEDDEELALQS